MISDVFIFLKIPTRIVGPIPRISKKLLHFYQAMLHFKLPGIYWFLFYSLYIFIDQEEKVNILQSIQKKEKSEHENKSTRSVKIMIGFEITAVYVYL